MTGHEPTTRTLRRHSYKRNERGSRSLQQIAQLVQSRTHVGAEDPAHSGGIRPAARRRRATALTCKTKKSQISRTCEEEMDSRLGLACGSGKRRRTVCREIKRNKKLEDRAIDADSAAWDRAVRPKHCKLVENLALARVRDRRGELLCRRRSRRIAQAYLSARREPARVTRDHLRAVSSLRRVGP